MIVDEVRIDKYLWSIRVYKTRSEATDACKGGKIRVNGSDIKPSRPVKVGDVIAIQMGANLMKAQVLDIREHTTKEAASSMYKMI